MGAKVNLARRLFLRRGAGAAAVAPFVPSALGGSQVFGAGRMLGGAIGGCKAYATNEAPSSGPIPDIIFNAYRKDRDARQRQDELRDMIRHQFGGFDPDIAALISVSPSFKVRMQVERTRRQRDEYDGFMAALKRRLGMPEDW